MCYPFLIHICRPQNLRLTGDVHLYRRCILICLHCLSIKYKAPLILMKKIFNTKITRSKLYYDTKTCCVQCCFCLISFSLISMINISAYLFHTNFKIWLFTNDYHFINFGLQIQLPNLQKYWQVLYLKGEKQSLVTSCKSSWVVLWDRANNQVLAKQLAF